MKKTPFILLLALASIAYQYMLHTQISRAESNSQLKVTIANGLPEPSIAQRWLQKQKEIGSPMWKDVALPTVPIAYKTPTSNWSVAVWDKTSGGVECKDLKDAPVVDGKVTFHLYEQKFTATVDKDIFVCQEAGVVCVGMVSSEPEKNASNSP